MHYLVSEENSNKVFAVIETVANKPQITKELVRQAVKDEFIYEDVELVDFNETHNTVAFDCVTEDGFEEIRAIQLTLTTLYVS